jgi:hypothetical protein
MFGRNIQRDGLGPAGIEGDALEAFEFLDGARDGTDAVTDVHLDDFIAGDLSGMVTSMEMVVDSSGAMTDFSRRGLENTKRV